jgi:integrase/recombinase XerD
MGELGAKFRRHMLLRGYRDATKELYEAAMVGLVRAHGGISPDRLTCDQVQAHVARLISERKLAWSTVNVHVSAFRCFYGEVLKRTTDAFTLPPRGRAHRRPAILDRESVAQLLAAHANVKHRALLELVYGSGLRVSEVCKLRPHHIESAADRMLVRVEQGKGRKDRYTLLSHRALELLREYWRQDRPVGWLFPGMWGRGPIAVETAQRVYWSACAKVGIARERGRGIHMLRHCFATHLLEQGVALPVIQRLLGHRDLSTTSVYCHVSRAQLEQVRSPGDTLTRS